MARTVATLPVGNRITDFISLGVIAKTFPVDKAHAILRATGKTARSSGSRGGLFRNRFGVVHAVVLSGGVSLLVGGRPVARPVGEGQGGGEVWHLADPDAAWMGTFAST